MNNFFSCSSKFSLWPNGILSGHTDWVTKICPLTTHPELIITTSRDKTILLWKIIETDGKISAVLQRSYVGHNYFISDCALTTDEKFFITASCDKTLRLWNISNTKQINVFKGHTDDVLGVNLTRDGRQIYSASRDRTIRLWNVNGKEKYVFTNAHEDYAANLVITPQETPKNIIISSGGDGFVKYWGIEPVGVQKIVPMHIGSINDLVINT